MGVSLDGASTYVHWVCGPKWLPVMKVVEFVHTLSTSSTTSWGNPRSSIRAKSAQWTIKPMCFES